MAKGVWGQKNVGGYILGKIGFWIWKVGSLRPQEMCKYTAKASDPPSSQELHDTLGNWTTELMLQGRSLSIEGTVLLPQGDDGIGGCEVGAGRSLPLLLCDSLNPGAYALSDPEQD